MNTKPAIDFIQLSETIRTRQDGRFEYILNNTFYDCELHFRHKSDFWPEEFWHTIPYHDWPKDGSDFSVVIGIPQHQQHQQIQYHTIPLNRINYIHSINDHTIIINIVQYEYILAFTSSETMRYLFELIYQKVPCFYWDTIITNARNNIFCLLNRNFSKINDENFEEFDDDDEETNNFVLIPPPCPKIEGQSTSGTKDANLTSMPPPPPPKPNEKNDHNDQQQQQDDDEDPFWDEDELDEIVYGDDF